MEMEVYEVEGTSAYDVATSITEERKSMRISKITEGHYRVELTKEVKPVAHNYVSRGWMKSRARPLEVTD